MPKISRPRHGSLQYWPRKRVSKILPRTNWDAIKEKSGAEGILGFIAYKVGMGTAMVRDLTDHSMTKEKKIAVPCTILEMPPMKIYSIRLYKNGIVADEIISENPEKEIKKKMKIPATEKKAEHKTKLENLGKDGMLSRYDNVRVLVYSLVKKTAIKKKPDLVEVGIAGNSLDEKMGVVKELMGKEIYASEVMKNTNLLDIRGVTKGKGFSGPVKRFGVELRPHKSEKGVRKAGSIGPWHPARLTFKTPLAGQLGMFTRVVYNSGLITMGKISSKDINRTGGFKNYGVIKTEYALLRGSVQGPQKRALLVTAPLRKTKKQAKKKYEFIELR